MSVKIITDSTSYIPKELIEKYDIKVVSLNVIMNNVSYRETELKNSEFYEMMDKSSEIPTSSQPSLDELSKILEMCVNEGNEVLCIFISSKMSGTFSSAHIVKNMIIEKYPSARIEIVDSATNSMQMGYEVIEAAKCASKGAEMKEIIDKVVKVRDNSRFLFVPDTLKYLQKGGRIGRASALLGGILQIRPILTVENGETTVFDKVRTKKKAVDVILNKVIEDCRENEVGGVIVHHINAEEEGMTLAKKLEENLNIPISIKSIGPVIGLHVGPGSIGVAYFTL
ncbi:DegV family protein [Clostridium butyricum]|uniref:DegV family protein n=1 Tax=Clostridium butyricum TaxID=1492 RepID=UPI00168AEDA5|nr:DegV family protein [Clostridium butyricum]MDB2151316.1 DegV family protein [Clostridium butyricum]